MFRPEGWRSGVWSVLRWPRSPCGRPLPSLVHRPPPARSPSRQVSVKQAPPEGYGTRRRADRPARQPCIHRTHRRNAGDEAGAARGSPPRRSRTDAVVRYDHRPERRQHLRRLPLAAARLRRHAVDRHRHRQQRDRRPGSNGPAQPAPHADGAQHRVLSRPDVELAVRRAVRRPVRQPAGFHFPPPEGLSLSHLPHLLVAQAFIPPTERVEVAGFDFPGDNDAIRHEVLRRLNDIEAYRQSLRAVVPGGSRRRSRSRSTCSAARSPSSSSRWCSPTRRSTASPAETTRP